VVRGIFGFWTAILLVNQEQILLPVLPRLSD